ncbi:hypothetical protein V6N11_032952 [Hibiscus sabdariffa]|uniref:Uncharacterized protein n=1 Tax=Hibiscus sabdariffa TaxID=183260 RepID=A0ABR2NCG8_9ROSI
METSKSVEGINILLQPSVLLCGLENIQSTFHIDSRAQQKGKPGLPLKRVALLREKMANIALLFSILCLSFSQLICFQANAQPTSEFTAGYDYSSGVWKFEGEAYISSGTTATSVMQVFGGSSCAITIML